MEFFSSLLELHRILKPTGSLYLHCDPTASHYLRILLDAIFGATSFRNEIVWKRTSAHSSAKRYGPVHDILLFYSKTKNYIWNSTYQEYDERYINVFFDQVDSDDKRWKSTDLTGSGVRYGETGTKWRGIDVTSKGRHWMYPPRVLDDLDAKGKIYWPKKKGGMPRLKQYLEDSPGVPLQDVWVDLPPIHHHSRERLGYPTQKPEALLERIIQASSNEGDTVLDPFCGCGTTVHAAQKLGRNWIGIDITHLAISLIEKRLRDAFPGVKYEVYGTPKDLDGAKALAKADKYQFQWWAVSLVNAVPYGGKKKGADTGIDGLIYFKPDGKKTERTIISVKGGEKVTVNMIRDLCAVIEREKAPIGIFITLANPTKPMIAEAASAGYFETEFGKYPRIQILTIVDLFNGKKPHIPFIDPAMFKKAPKADTDHQEDLFKPKTK